jgi:N-sulfoglucosamine sulfohydrolase
MNLNICLLCPLLCVIDLGCGLLVQAAPPSQRPNILIAIADDWSFPHAGSYGADWVKTPAFDRVAREGILFTHAYAPVAKCSASRFCIVTGRNPWQLEAGFTHQPFYPPQFRSYPECLAVAGYATGYTHKGCEPGVAHKADGTNRQLVGRLYEGRKVQSPAKGIGNHDYAANFGDFLADVPPGQPWCFWYGAHEPHRGYEYGSGVAKGGKNLADINRAVGCWPDDKTVRNDMLDYAFEVEWFDLHLARILDMIAARGELERTLVIVTSDNGMPFPRGKGQSYELSCHMPLAISWPGKVNSTGRTVDDYVSSIDIAPTILAAAGIDWAAAGMSPTPGHSLIPLLTAKRGGRIDPVRDHVLLGRERHDPGRPHNHGYPIRAIVRDDWFYLHNYATDRWPSGNPETGYRDVDSSPTKTLLLERRRAAGSDPYWDLAFAKRDADELYDLSHDPDCVKNLAADPAQAARVAELRKQLEAELVVQGDPRLLGHPDYFDKFPFSVPAYNDFYEHWQAGEPKTRALIRDAEPKPLD